MTHSRRRVQELLAQWSVAPSKALGQNFVADPNLVRHIARLADIGPDDHVVEIGPGLGSLTLALAETGRPVLAVEVDARLADALSTIVDPASVRVVQADAMQADWDALLQPADARWVLVANLPYNIATPLVADLLDHVPRIERLVVMVQREVADRLVAPPGSKTYGLPSLKVAYWADARIVSTVPPDVFVPRPNVDSAVVRIDRRAAPACASGDRLFALARQAFHQRRKMLRRSLAGVVEPADFAAAGVAPEARPEQLGVDDWCRLAGAVEHHGR